jgi:hypothetical protein
MALLEMGLLGLLLRFCHRLLSGATHLRLLVTWQATSPIQRGIGRGNAPVPPFPLLSRAGRSSGSSPPFPSTHGTLAEAAMTAEGDSDAG